MRDNLVSLKFCSAVLLLVTLNAVGKSKSLVIGAQNIDYFPHYNFNSTLDKGYAGAVFQAFGDKHHYQITYITLPTKRLQTELIKGTVDLAYPDNERWGRLASKAKGKHYSAAIAYATGGTMVLSRNVSLPIEQFKTLAIPHGFTPAKWFESIAKYNIKVTTFYDASAALQAVILGRADGADVEYHVARHLLKVTGRSEKLVMATHLPSNIVEFKASTFKHPKILKELDEFIRSNPELIELLENQYQLKTAVKPGVIEHF